MKIDYHNHILPGLDDGAKDMADSLMLLNALCSWGFERVTCTPHINHKYQNTPAAITRAFDNLLEEVDKAGLKIGMRLSAEYRLVPETWPEVLKKNWIMPIEDKYILMELPISKPYEMGNLKPIEEFRKVISMGLTPLLPHPERYAYLSEDELCRYIDTGVVVQSNYGSLAGLYGEEVRDRVLKFKEKGYISLYGTDLHNDHYVEILNDWFATNPL